MLLELCRRAAFSVRRRQPDQFMRAEMRAELTSCSLAFEDIIDLESLI